MTLDSSYDAALLYYSRQWFRVHVNGWLPGALVRRALECFVFRRRAINLQTLLALTLILIGIAMTRKGS
jgi:hypothetical protein